MAETPTLAGVRILVVGASAGIGRSFVRHAVAMGGLVCASARRRDKLVELCSEAGGGHPVAGDVTVGEDCERIVSVAADHLGGLDLVLYTAGTGVLSPLIDADAEVWRRVHDVNVVGPMLLCRAALPVLGPDGVFSFMSSEAAGQTRWGLGAYASSKAALDTAIGYWRHEHPERRFQRIVMGATFPTEFGSGFGDEVLGTAMARWAASGVQHALMDTDDVGLQLAEVMALTMAHPEIDLHDLKLAARGHSWEPPAPA
jgi:NAD(P)-dependent dehydrogenase (short-subunit alcohol dehydrogenase family)